ncbi:MAG: hypothetical protein RLY57_277 [Candidatus Parcubacteria bacterium]|jgi:uncharacterized membrane protein YphA (DoxX/SURF4 family)
MLSFFPELLNWSMLAPTILRLTLAYFLFVHAFNAFWKEDSITKHILHSIFFIKTAHVLNRVIGYLRIIAGTLLVLGLFTQVGALIALVLYILRLQTRKYHGEEAMVDSLLGIIALSIALLGPGAFSIDLPL